MDSTRRLHIQCFQHSSQRIHFHRRYVRCLPFGMRPRTGAGSIQQPARGDGSGCLEEQCSSSCTRRCSRGGCRHSQRCGFRQEGKFQHQQGRSAQGRHPRPRCGNRDVLLLIFRDEGNGPQGLREYGGRQGWTLHRNRGILPGSACKPFHFRTSGDEEAFPGRACPYEGLLQG